MKSREVNNNRDLHKVKTEVGKKRTKDRKMNTLGIHEKLRMQQPKAWFRNWVAEAVHHYITSMTCCIIHAAMIV
jgi:hypothetical protein